MSAPKAWRLELGTRPPLSMNDRRHWTASSKAVKQLRHLTATRAASLGLPKNLEHISTQLVWLTPDKRRRDEDNITSTAKAAWDGLVDYGIVPDDTPNYMTKLMPRIIPHPTRGQSRCDLWVWEAHRVESVPETIINQLTNRKETP